MIKVVAAIIFRNEKVLIARRAPHKSMAGYWEFPGGKVNKNESLPNALIREIREEFSVELSNIKYFATTTHCYPDFDIKLTAYIAEVNNEIENSTDHDKLVWTRVDNLENYNFLGADKPLVNKLFTLHKL